MFVLEILWSNYPLHSFWLQFSNSKNFCSFQIIENTWYENICKLPPSPTAKTEDLRRFLKYLIEFVFDRVNGMRMAYGYYPGLGADTRCTESGGFDELRQLCYKLMESIASNRQLWGAQVYVPCNLLLYWLLRQYVVQLFLFSDKMTSDEFFFIILTWLTHGQNVNLRIFFKSFGKKSCKNLWGN